MSKTPKLPLISVVMITYAHQNFIGEAIEGVLNQEGDFDLELIICDDASPDNTSSIVDHHKVNHPNGKVIRYIRHKSNFGMSANFLYGLRQAQGHYIALCEGDDYWTDNFKLIKQVEVLESDRSCSLCCHDVADQHGKKFVTQLHAKKRGLRTYFGLNEFSKYWIIRTPSLIFKSNLINFECLSQYNYFRDRHLFYHLLKAGRGCYLHENMAVYRIHQGGVHSGQAANVRLHTAINVSKELWQRNQDKFTRFMYLRSLLNKASYSSFWNKNLFGEMWPLIHSLDDLFLISKYIAPKFVKKIVKRISLLF